MIAYIRGLLAEKEPTRVVIEAAGVGYELLIPLSTYDRLPHVDEEVKLLAWHCVREDDEILFGFATEDERDVFTLLTSVSGVGPKIAIAILSGAAVGELAMMIAAGEVKRLSSIKGVGKKTAEKICVELRDKMGAYAFSAKSGEVASPIVRDAVAALRALGFNEETSAKMVTETLVADPKIDSVEKVIRKALSSKG